MKGVYYENQVMVEAQKTRSFYTKDEIVDEYIVWRRWESIVNFELAVSKWRVQVIELSITLSQLFEYPATSAPKNEPRLTVPSCLLS